MYEKCLSLPEQIYNYVIILKLKSLISITKKKNGYIMVIRENSGMQTHTLVSRKLRPCI